MADPAEAPETREVSREEARKLLDDGAQLIDVRADHEWETGRIPGAVHIPLAELGDRAGEIDRERPRDRARGRLRERVRRGRSGPRGQEKSRSGLNT